MDGFKGFGKGYVAPKEAKGLVRSIVSSQAGAAGGESMALPPPFLPAPSLPSFVSPFLSLCLSLPSLHYMYIYIYVQRT